MENGIGTANAVLKCGSGDNSDRIVEQRLGNLLRLNAEIARQKSLFENERQRRKALTMTRPMDSRRAFAIFGAMMGSLPPLALVIKILASSRGTATGISLLITAAAIVTTIVAFQIGRGYIPGALRSISGFSLPNRVALWSFLGFAWGAMSGAAGGVFIFLIGSIIAAIAGGIAGAVALPLMVGLHTSVKVGDFIETKHFLPIAFGVTLSICAFILGL